MSQALNYFADSYLKRLKRPELFNYNADQSFGANMVHGSEKQNPWANRDQDNAKFGNLGGDNNKVIQGPQVFAGDQIDPSLGGKTFTLPQPIQPGVISNPSQDIMNSLMGTITKPVGEYIGKNASEWLNPTPTFSDTLNNFALNSGGEVGLTDFASRLGNMGEGALSDFDFTMGKGGDAFKGIGEGLTKGSTDALKGVIGGGDTSSFLSGFDPMSMGLSVVPAVGRAFGLKGTAGDALGATAGVGAAALQGGMNPIADVGALMSVFKLIRGLF